MMDTGIYKEILLLDQFVNLNLSAYSYIRCNIQKDLATIRIATVLHALIRKTIVFLLVAICYYDLRQHRELIYHTIIHRQMRLYNAFQI